MTKGDTGPVALYRFPPDARPNSMATLVRVGTARPSHKADGKGRITDGAISPNGEWAVLRTNCPEPETFDVAPDLNEALALR